MNADTHDRLWRHLLADQERQRAKLIDPNEVDQRIREGLEAKAGSHSTFNAGRIGRGAESGLYPHWNNRRHR